MWRCSRCSLPPTSHCCPRLSPRGFGGGWGLVFVLAQQRIDLCCIAACVRALAADARARGGAARAPRVVAAARVVRQTCGICRFFTDEVGTLQREPPTGDCGFALGVPSIPPCGALDMHGGEGLMTGLADGIFDGMAALRVMDLGSHPISELPAGVFDSLSELRQLEMHFFALTSLPVDIFKNNTKLEFLGLRENSLTTLPVGIFSNLTKLAFLSLRANGMSLVPAGLFNGLSALEELDLVSNLFDRLPVDIFQNLTALRVLRMPNNGLQVLDPNTFAGLDKLEHLDIRSNQIGDLTPSLLDGLPSLRILQVGSNPLGPTLPGALFANATNLEALYMPDAELESLPNKPLRNSTRSAQKKDRRDKQSCCSFCVLLWTVWLPLY